MYSTFAENQMQIPGANIAGCVEQFVDANAVIDRAKQGAYEFDFFGCPVQEKIVEAKAVKPTRRVGTPALSKERMEFIRGTLCSSTPAEVGLSARSWSVAAVQELVVSKYELSVSSSTARNYIRKFGMAAPKPMNRRKAEFVSRKSEVWLNEEFTVLKAKAKAAKQNIVWLSCSPLAVQDLFSSGTVVHAVANRTGKASWLVAPDHNRIGSLGDLFDSIGAGSGEVPIVIFDESITSNFKAEIEAFLHVKSEARKDGGGTTKKKVVDCLSTKKWLQTSFRNKAEFSAVDVFVLQDDSELEADVAEKLMKNEESFKVWSNPDEVIAEELIAALRSDLCNLKLKSYGFADAFGWMLSEGYEIGQFNWCTLILGLDKDRMRATIMQDVATHKNSDSEKRRIAWLAYNEYA